MSLQAVQERLGNVAKKAPCRTLIAGLFSELNQCH